MFWRDVGRVDICDEASAQDDLDAVGQADQLVEVGRDQQHRKPVVTGELRRTHPITLEWWRFAQSLTDRPVKGMLTGPYTICDWSFDEHYFTDHDMSHAHADRKGKRHEARRRFILDVARNMIRPNIEALIGLGAKWIQLDEPGGSTDPEELDHFAEAFNETVQGLDAVFSTHLCFSDYNLFFPGIEAMTACRQFAVGFALLPLTALDATWLWTTCLWLAVVLALVSGGQYLWHANLRNAPGPAARVP